MSYIKLLILCGAAWHSVCSCVSRWSSSESVTRKTIRRVPRLLNVLSLGCWIHFHRRKWWPSINTSRTSTSTWTMATSVIWARNSRGMYWWHTAKKRMLQCVSTFCQQSIAESKVRRILKTLAKLMVQKLEQPNPQSLVASNINVKANFSDRWLRYLIWNCSQVNVTRPYSWEFNIGNGLMPSGNKPLPELILTRFHVTVCVIRLQWVYRDHFV